MLANKHTKSYVCIDLKSFYASVECVDRGLDPFTENLVVADPDRGSGTICLAITPAMKALGVKNRCRIFQIPNGIEYTMATPRMARYMEVSAQINALYLRYVSTEDIHVYSIDECFIDATPYLKLYRMGAKAFAEMLRNKVTEETGITATAGIGPNLFLAKVALDIEAKKAADGIGILDEESYKREIWFHRPITDIWQVGPGIAHRLADALGIRYYDKELIRMASEDSGISEELFARADENTRKTMLYRVSERVYDGSTIPPESGNFISDENLFNYQAKVLRELLNEESYICVGRAADFVLRDKPNVLTVYVDAPYDWRVEREMKRQGIGSSQAKHYIDKLDRYRESYYKYHTGRQWKRVENYDLCLDSAAIGLDNCVELIKKVIELKFDGKAK